MMLCHAIIKDNPMYMAGVTLVSIMFVLSVILTVMTYLELQEKY